MPCPDLQPETGASRDTAGPDYSRQNSSTSALIRRIRADPCALPASRAKPACAGYSRQTVIRADPRSIPASGTCADWIGARRCHAEAAPLGHGMPCPDLQPEADASRDTAGPDYSRQNSSTSALIRRIRADPCSIPPSTLPCGAQSDRLRQYSGCSAIQSNTQSAGSQFSVPGSQFPVLGSRFSVLGSQFPVLSSQPSVPGSQFSVLSSQFSVPGSQFSVPR
jgi:hypothetical protein